MALPILMLIVFVVSANLDNLTTTVMALTLIHQVISNRRYRMIYGSVAVIAANMGGALTVIGSPAMIIGAGRATKEDVIDHAVGIKILKKVGDKVNKNEKIAEIYYNDSKNVENSKNMILDAYVILEEKVEKQKAILEIIE